MASLIPSPSSTHTWWDGPSVLDRESVPRRSALSFPSAWTPTPAPASSRHPVLTDISSTSSSISQCEPAAPQLAYTSRPPALLSHGPATLNDINLVPGPSSWANPPFDMAIPPRRPLPSPPSLPPFSPATLPDDISLQNASPPTLALAPPQPSTNSVSNSTGAARVREKRHPCWMCHKAFDRPSTLRKHLLVHTGEKAYACESCGRRFGVLSNLNRHIRRCTISATRCENNQQELLYSPADNGSQNHPASPDTVESLPSPALVHPVVTSTSPDPSLETPATVNIEPFSAQQHRSQYVSETVLAAGSGASRRRRPRRAPSPEQWVPPSLRLFNLSPMNKACSMPLAPVLPFSTPTFVEERNSYNDQPSERPYHPTGWCGRLPGPALRDFIGSSMSTMGCLVRF